MTQSMGHGDWDEALAQQVVLLFAMGCGSLLKKNQPLQFPTFFFLNFSKSSRKILLRWKIYLQDSAVMCRSRPFYHNVGYPKVGSTYKLPVDRITTFAVYEHMFIGHQECPMKPNMHPINAPVYTLNLTKFGNLEFFLEDHDLKG